MLLLLVVPRFGEYIKDKRTIIYGFAWEKREALKLGWVYEGYEQTSKERKTGKGTGCILMNTVD